MSGNIFWIRSGRWRSSKELRALTGDDDGAQRVAFTPIWAKAREWLKAKLAELPVETHTDAAGNLWSTLRGESEKSLLIGGHMDSVPNGGWLDGCLNVLAGLEVLRRIDAQYDGKPPVTVRLVDWADEEGARFGNSLFGSSACSGNLDLDEARGPNDRTASGCRTRSRNIGIDFEQREGQPARARRTRPPISSCTSSRARCCSTSDLPLGVVLGTFGVERHAITFHGQAAHSGSTPMNRRKRRVPRRARR